MSSQRWLPPMLMTVTLLACSSSGGTGSSTTSGSATSGGTTVASGAAASSGSGSSGSSSATTTAASAATSGGSSGGTSTAGGSAGSGGNPNFAGSGCPLFPPSYAYNQDVSQLAPDPNSATYLSSLTSLAPTINPEWPGTYYYNIVPASQAQVSFNSSNTFVFLPDGGVLDETSTPTAPIPPDVVYENESCCQGADHHLGVLQQGSCRLYEAYSVNPALSDPWAILLDYDLGTIPQIPDSFDNGSTTQAGTPLTIGTIWPVEVNAGVISHALDIQMADNAVMPCAYVHPASTVRYSGAPANQGIPYGVKLRLKASYDSSGFTGRQALVVVKALQTYGMIPTDASGETRSTLRCGHDPDGGTLNQNDINQLSALTWDDFDVMPVGTILTEKGCTP